MYLFNYPFNIMSSHADSLRLALGREPLTARQLIELLSISQPTVSRALTALGDELVRIGAGRSIQYALYDKVRGLGEMPVYRVGADGGLRRLGVLVPVCPEGFVMRQDDGASAYSAGLPWWLLDMRPQGFLGRAFAAGHAAALGLPAQLNDWTDTHALRALLVHGDDAVGNLLLGDLARARFLDRPPPTAVGLEDFPALAAAAERGEPPGSSAGGEQPKFAAFVGRHVLVKFTAAEDNPVTRRWRDLLAAEHLAAQVLLEAGIPAARSRLLDAGGRRFLEVERFDRAGTTGRRALHSLLALEAEFVGDARSPWPVLTARLAAQGIVAPQAAAGAALLFAFGTLIGNADMHHGNLSFVAEHGRPYALAPAYDMLPMALRPLASGALPAMLPAAYLHPSVTPAVWRQALALAREFVARLPGEACFSPQWQPCAAALAGHVEEAGAKIGRLV